MRSDVAEKQRKNIEQRMAKFETTINACVSELRCAQKREGLQDALEKELLKRLSVALLFTARGIPEEEGGKQLFQDVSNGARFGKELALDAIARDFNATDEFKDNNLGEEDALQKKLQQQMLAIPHFPVESIHDLMTQRQITALPK